MRLLLCVLTALSVASCGGSSAAKKPDAKPADAYFSNCGHPGDMGNELGIGQFCAGQSDCANTNAAPLCSSLGDSTTHFCTKTCTSMGSAGQCGTGGIECVCNSGNQCGCTPSICLHD